MDAYADVITAFLRRFTSKPRWGKTIRILFRIGPFSTATGATFLWDEKNTGMCKMSDYLRFVIMRARSFLWCVLFFMERGVIGSWLVLFKHTCYFDVNKLSFFAGCTCILLLNYRSFDLKNIKRIFAEVCFEFITCI